MGRVIPFAPAAEVFEQEVVALLREDFPKGWIVHDMIVSEEQVDVLTILPQGIAVIECKSYTGQICGDPNGPWVARKGAQETVIEPRNRNPYRQALTKAFAVGDFLQAILQANPQLGVEEQPWIHACAVFPEGAELSGLRSLPVDPKIVLPHGQGKAIVFHPSHLSWYLGNLNNRLASELASALVRALGGKADGTWMEEKAIQNKREKNPIRWKLDIEWEENTKV